MIYIPHVSARDGIARKVFRLADLTEQQQQLKLKDTKNELGHWRHVFSNIIIIVTAYIQLIMFNIAVYYYSKLVCRTTVHICNMTNCVVLFFHVFELLDLASGMTIQMAIRHVIWLISFTNKLNAKHQGDKRTYYDAGQAEDNQIPSLCLSMSYRTLVSIKFSDVCELGFVYYSYIRCCGQSFFWPA